MTTKYCMNCRQEVTRKRIIGVGTIFMILITLFLWVLIIPLYQKRCPICKGAKWGVKRLIPVV